MLFTALKLNEDPNPGGGGGGDPKPAPAGNWFDTVQDTEAKSWLQNKNYKDLDTAINSFRGLEKTIGVPKERLLHLPENMADQKAMEAIYNRLGRPEKADGYKITAAEGSDDKFSAWFREQAHSLGLTASMAEGLAAKFGEFTKAQDEEFVTSQTNKFNEEANALKKEWGAAHDQNINIAKEAANKFGVKPEIVAKLEKEMGYGDLMKFFHNIGTKIGDPQFLDSQGGKNFGSKVPTPAQALSKIEELKKDSIFQTRFLSGDSAAVKEWNDLHVYLTPPT